MNNNNVPPSPPDTLNLPTNWARLDLNSPLLSAANCVAGAHLDFTSLDLAAMSDMSGLSSPEPTGVWTVDRQCSVKISFPHACLSHCLLVITARPFLWEAVLPEQRFVVSIDGKPVGERRLTAHSAIPRKHVFVVPREILGEQSSFTLTLDIPTCRSPKELGINKDGRKLGLHLVRLELYQTNTLPPADWLFWQLGRQVGHEAMTTFDQKIESGFWSRYACGKHILDIGFRGGSTHEVQPILPNAIGVDLDYPGYDGRTLPFADDSQDVVYASHCLEHVAGFIAVLQDWYRVLRVGGHMIISVPHAHLYERGRRPPSQWNLDHQRFYTPASLLVEIEAALAPNSYRIRHMEDNDLWYDYVSPPDKHPNGCYEITLVVEKITPPKWTLRN